MPEHVNVRYFQPKRPSPTRRILGGAAMIITVGLWIAAVVMLLEMVLPS